MPRSDPFWWATEAIDDDIALNGAFVNGQSLQSVIDAILEREKNDGNSPPEAAQPVDVGSHGSSVDAEQGGLDALPP